MKPFPRSRVKWDDAIMSEIHDGPTQDHGQHLHAHEAPTTAQMRTVGQRRREAEEKLEHHLDEARHKEELRHKDEARHSPDGEAVTETGRQEEAGEKDEVDGSDVAAIQNDDRLTAADRVDLIANQAVAEPDEDKGRNR